MLNHIGEIVPYLLDWFRYNARILPWREEPKPYYVWISEIMLQQTRVEAVKGYFDGFITALPDIRSLAEAEEEKLLKLWEGLGYYSRVRNLQKTAKILLKDYQGELPSDYNELRKLPGIGAYTAGAIASIAYQRPAAAVDGNVLRVMMRITAGYDDITREKTKQNLARIIEDIMPQDQPGDFNQSLMELGATICLPNGKPLCEQCPVMHLCKAFHQGLIQSIPVKSQKKERRRENRTVLLIEYGKKTAIHKRMDKGLLTGLWEYPNLEGHYDRDEMMAITDAWGLNCASIEYIGVAKHIFTHIEWHMIGYHMILTEDPTDYSQSNQIIFADSDQIREFYSIPNAFSAYTKFRENFHKD